MEAMGSFLPGHRREEVATASFSSMLLWLLAESFSPGPPEDTSCPTPNNAVRFLLTGHLFPPFPAQCRPGAACEWYPAFSQVPKKACFLLLFVWSSAVTSVSQARTSPSSPLRHPSNCERSLASSSSLKMKRSNGNNWPDSLQWTKWANTPEGLPRSQVLYWHNHLNMKDFTSNIVLTTPPPNNNQNWIKTKQNTLVYMILMNTM